MPTRTRSVVFAILCSSFAALSLAADLPQIKVQSRELVMPELPAGSERPMNLPEDGAIKMPFVTGGAVGVAGRINDSVWRDMLDGLPAPSTPGRTFTPPPDRLPQGTISLDYTTRFIPKTQPRLLSLAFSGEGCGAYCEDYSVDWTFDLRDGRKLVLGDLLTPEGFAAVGRQVDGERRSAYGQQVRKLRAALRSLGKHKIDDEDLAERLALNEDCLKQVDSSPTAPKRLLAESFKIDGRGGIVMSRGRCSNHAMRALDDVGDLSIPIAAAPLKPMLTAYGRAVVRAEGDAPPPPDNIDGRELHGRLGNMAITMKLEPFQDGVETRGWYAYDKYRTPIALAVRKDGDDVQAVEQTTGRGRFDLTPAGASLAGTWSDKDERKELPVVLQ
ncbi:MAG: hypothetical protein KKC85_12085 [Gammaproteobacteria bacterium]|nr:hypothetical protein [Gammaproteobacteria bacterium]MBU1441964.1 hypothetical protein [Gammaproteobacteria bacterium]MBU2287166.1 hypothetical protein [Gammaproteobacteria bacterium]